MTITHDLIKKQKRRKQSASVDIDLYPLASDLYEELTSIGAIQRMKDTPQLGVIKVKKDYEKSRFDYVILQLYLHQLIKRQLKNQLQYSYNNQLAATEFGSEFDYPDPKFKLSIMDVIQVLIIVYNIGHFRNTFVASRAAVLYAGENKAFLTCLKESSVDSRFAEIVQTMIENANYQRFHLINSWLILDKCNQGKASIQIAKEILFSYINEGAYAKESKFKYIFFLFRAVRNVAYIAYDLQIAQTPLTIDLCDSKAMVMLLKERLSIYNDNRQMSQMIDSIGKMLDDSVYNEESNAICYYMVTANIKNQLKKKDWRGADYYEECWASDDSVFNIAYSQHRDFNHQGILKLTFAATQRQEAQKLFKKLEHTDGIRAGYYDRSQGEQTVLASLKKNCKAERATALRVLRIAISHLRNVQGINASDFRYLLCVKFFLYYFMGNRSIVIKPTISRNICVICSKGKKQRLNKLKKLLAEGGGTEDSIHEVYNLLNVLEMDSANDICISIPASILTYEPDHQDKAICEFDGMIIFPNRKTKQVILLEAKNRKWKKSVGKKDLIKKLNVLGIPYNANEIEVSGKDAVYPYSI